MDDGPYWVILLKYGSHDMRHTGFHRLTVVNDPRVLGCHNKPRLALKGVLVYFLAELPQTDVVQDNNG